MAILTDAEQVRLQNFLQEMDAVNTNVSFVRYLIPWYRRWRTKNPVDFLPANTDLSAIDEQARTVAANAHARLDKLRKI